MLPDLLIRGASLLVLPLLPLLYLQGRGVRRRTPLLPEAAGPQSGSLPGAEPTLHLLVIGESTVAGVGAASHQEALTGQLAAALVCRTGRGVRWRALGRSGLTAHEVKRDLLPLLPDARAELVVIALGVNNVLRLRGPRRWARDLAALITAIRERLGPVPVVLAPVPPMHLFPGLPQPLRGVLGLRARALDSAARRLARRLPDVTHAVLHFEGAVEEYFCEDRFHPSVRGYASWGEQLAQAALPLLETPPMEMAAKLSS